MSCFFPPIFKKNTYKWVRFFTVSSIVLALLLLFSGCKFARAVVAAPFKAVGWSATKVSEAVSGEKENTGPKVYKLNPDGTLTEKNTDNPAPTTGESGNKITFKPLVVWAIMLTGLAILVRFLVKKYVKNDTKK